MSYIDNNTFYKNCNLKKSTEEFFAKQYAYLLFSDNDKNEFVIDNILDRKILVINEVKSIVNNIDTRKKTIRSIKSYNRVLVDYYYLNELAKANGTELSYIDNDNLLKFELSWSDKNKFTEAKMDPNFNWANVKKMM